MSKLQESLRTTAQEDEFPETNLDEQSFEAELEQVYLDKLRQQRAKVDILTRDFEEARQLLQQKEYLLKSQQRNIPFDVGKLQFLGDQASYKTKFDDLMQTLRQTEAQKDSLTRECDNLRGELAECIRERNALLKEVKECMRDTDFKLQEKQYQTQEMLRDKDRQIEQLKQRNNQLLRRSQEETFKKDIASKMQHENSTSKEQELTYEVQRLNRLINARDEENAQLTDSLDNLQFRCENMQQQLLNKEEELQSQATSHHKLLQKMKFHIRLLRHELADKEKLIAQQKENLDKANDSIRKHEIKLAITAEQLRLQERNHTDILNKANFDWSQDKQSFLETTRGLKANVDELIRVKSQLLHQNDRLHAVAKHRQSTEKIKSSITGKQHREIDYLSRVLMRQ